MLYTYRCDYCNEVREVEHPVAECDQPHPCPICKRGMVRQIQRVAFGIKAAGGKRNIKYRS